MRKLEKLVPPAPPHGATIEALRILRLEHDTTVAAGDQPTDHLKGQYRTVRDAVRCETSEKCAYCECIITDTYVGDVEHMLPKANHYTRTLDYENLTFACWKCNNHKGNKEFQTLNFLNPYMDEPGDYLRFFGLTLRPVPRNPHMVRAKRTIDTMDLNRQALLDSRERVHNLCESLEMNYHGTTYEAVRDMVKEQIDKARSADAEHSMLARQYFDTAGL